MVRYRARHAPTAAGKSWQLIAENIAFRSRYKGGQAVVDQTDEEARPAVKVHSHRQTALLRGGEARCDVRCRTSIAQWPAIARKIPICRSESG